MTMTNPAKRRAQRGRARATGPAAAFAATVLLAFAALILAAVTLPKDTALAAISSLFFAFAALVALLAWRLRGPDDRALSYWDVAGALTLFGICTATLMDSDQLVRLIESQRHAN
ncbi:MAG: hypothetical protein ACRECO_02415 [Xanthobacteraceae bacterium]